MKGLGAAASGQASSVSPLTHNASNSSPADSSTPSTWIGASGVSGWNRVSVQRWRNRASACAKDILGATRSSLANSASVSLNLARVWNSSESRPRSPGKPAASRSAEKCRAQSCGERSPPGCSRTRVKSASSHWRSTGAPSISATNLPSAMRAGASLRSAASSSARCESSGSAPSRNGERISLLACSKGISPEASSRMESAARASGYSASGAPSEMLKGSALRSTPGRLRAGCMTRANTRATSLRRCPSSGTTTPIRFAPASSFARAQLAAASSSSRADGKGMRLAFASFSSGAQVRTSMP